VWENTSSDSLCDWIQEKGQLKGFELTILGGSDHVTGSDVT